MRVRIEIAGLLCGESGFIERALEDYKELIRLQPGRAQNFVERGGLYQRLGR